MTMNWEKGSILNGRTCYTAYPFQNDHGDGRVTLTRWCGEEDLWHLRCNKIRLWKTLSGEQPPLEDAEFILKVEIEVAKEEMEQALKVFQKKETKNDRL